MPRLICRASALALIAAVFVTPVVAAEACQPGKPGEVAKAAINTALTNMEKHSAEYRADPEALYQMIDETLIPIFDLDYMARLVLGRSARETTPDQMERFIYAFKLLLIRTYANALFEIQRDQIEYLPVRAPEGSNDVVFQTEVTTDDGEQIPVHLDMHLVDCKWQIYNAKVDNISYLINYRGQFQGSIETFGIEGLIDAIESGQFGG